MIFDGFLSSLASMVKHIEFEKDALQNLIKINQSLQNTFGIWIYTPDIHSTIVLCSI
jgi:hypothetical protein